MSADITIFEKEQKARFDVGTIEPYESTISGKTEVCTLELLVGGSKLTIHFETPESLIKFCTRHNVKIEDNRTPVVDEDQAELAL
jgi:hypothetical protein